MIKRFARDTFFYMFFSFLNMGVSFLLLPIFARYLLPEDYGAYALFLTVVMICYPIVMLSSHEAVVYVYFNSNLKIGRYVGTIILSGAAILFLLTLGIFYLSKIWRGQYALAPLIAFSECVTIILCHMWRIQERPISYGLFNFFCASLKLLLNIALVAWWQLGWQEIIQGQAVFSFFVIILVLYFLKKNEWFSLVWDRESVSLGIRLGIGCIPASLCSRFSDSLGRLFLAGNFSMKDVGIYSMGQKLGGLVDVYTGAFINVFQPWLFKKLSSSGEKEIKSIARVVGVACLLLILVAILGGLVLHILKDFVLTERFRDSFFYVLWAMIAYVMRGMYIISASFILYSGKTWVMSSLMILQLSLNALFTKLFLSYSGMEGVIYAPVLAWFLTLIASCMVIKWLWLNYILNS